MKHVWTIYLTPEGEANNPYDSLKQWTNVILKCILFLNLDTNSIITKFVSLDF